MIEFSEATNEDITKPKFYFFVENISTVLDKNVLVQWFTACQRPTLIGIPDKLKGQPFIGMKADETESMVLERLSTVHVFHKDPTEEQLGLSDPKENEYIYGVMKQDDYFLLMLLSDNALNPPYWVADEFMLEDGMIANYTSTKPVRTDVGKFLVNYIVLAEPFGDKIPYINDTIKTDVTDKKVAELISEDKIGRKEFNRYINNAFWFGEDGTMFAAALSEKTVGYDPKLTAKRKELYEKYKDRMNDPTVLTAIEKELADMENAYIKGDESEPFFLGAGKKTKEARKKFFCLYGMTRAFGDVEKSGFTFTKESLEEGWNQLNFANCCNSVRRGTYGRSLETAKGGSESKFILRIFQEVKIIEDDCHDTRGMTIKITKNNIKTLMSRYLVSGEIIDESNADSLIGKTVRIRSPMTCKTKGGYCYKCCGKIFEETKQAAIGMQTLTITSAFTTDSMKTMHTSQVSTKELTDLNQYVVEK